MRNLRRFQRSCPNRRHGALIVLQRNSSLQEYIRTGIQLDSVVSADLLATLFWPRTELHDGAVIIDNSGAHRLSVERACLLRPAAICRTRIWARDIGRRWVSAKLAMRSA